MSGKGDLGLTLDQRYQLVSMLGTGTSGAVYRGRDLQENRRVAVKLLHRDMLTSEEAVARFFREIGAAERIEHPGVVGFYGAGMAADGRPYIVQEFLHGEDMEEALATGRLQLPQIFEVSLQLLDALNAVHGAGLVHRDVKPENVFLFFDEFGGIRVKLVDFGIAKPKTDMADELTGAGQTVGTPHYMSPEQARGTDLDARADLWSVGVVLFEALTGILPFDDQSPFMILTKIVMEPAPPLAQARGDLPAGLCEVVDRALQRDLSKRWQTAPEMAQALRQSVGLR
jgi:serine/threonine protein kinase